MVLVARKKAEPRTSCSADGIQGSTISLEHVTVGSLEVVSTSAANESVSCASVSSFLHSVDKRPLDTDGMYSYLSTLPSLVWQFLLRVSPHPTHITL